MKAPTHLKHKPIISANDYDKIDAQYSEDTDVRALLSWEVLWAD